MLSIGQDFHSARSSFAILDDVVVEGRVGTKNRIRALLRTHGIIAPRSLWTVKGRAWLEGPSRPRPRKPTQIR